MTYAVIMAGGIGSRFWPRSRRARPKQFLSVFGDATLLQNTVARLEGFIPPERCFVVTNARYVEQTREQLPGLPPENILGEPISRNTAPCIAFAAHRLAAIDPEATMVVLPADHVIADVAAFHDVLRAAVDQSAEQGALVTIGIEPTYPATGYGYVQFEDGGSGPPSSPRPVRTFAEKPDVATAERFIDSGDFLWNSGMFVWRVDTILGALERYLPDTFEAFRPLSEALGTTGEADAVVSAFQASRSISIDYGVMERADHVYVVPGRFGWSDVGDWKVVYDLSDKDQHGNAIRGRALLRGSSRCMVATENRLIVLVGVHDMIVVDTDDAVLVCHRDNAQQVKQVVDYLHAHQLEDYV